MAPFFPPASDGIFKVFENFNSFLTKRIAVVAALWFSKWGNENGDSKGRREGNEGGYNRFFLVSRVFLLSLQCYRVGKKYAY